ncbi:MAG: GGDEF domain-containing protein [Geminicoccaceae bacterium]|nr:MAG: GGDEF domain-containing protein [Geminicoccaceae bacterium]
MAAPCLVDAIPIAAARLDSATTVIETNALWRAWGMAHCVPCPAMGVRLDEAWRHLPAPVRQAWQNVCRTGHDRAQADYGLDTTDGSRRWYRLEICHLAGGGFVVLHSDVTAHRNAVAAAEREALVDPLTGLWNRRAIDRLLAERVPAATAAQPTLLALIDVDDFKLVNDRFGHVMGDRVLCELADRLVAAVRKGDEVGRIGGDEFVVLVNGVASLGQARELSERLRRAIERPIDLDGVALDVKASMGTTLLDGSQPDAVTALAIADRRMYRDKGLQCVPSPSLPRLAVAG